jgi:Sap-like sulfolipid-1-addressing protein
VWGSVLGLAFLVAINPVLLAVILLMVSRPRPVQNLLAYWVGGLIVNGAYVLGPLMVLHLTPTFASFAQGLAAPATSGSSTVRHIQFGMGVLALSIAALMTVRFLARQRAHLSALVPDSNTPTAISPLGLAQNAATEGGSAIRRLLGRLQNAWDNGSLWVAFVFGLGG